MAYEISKMNYSKNMNNYITIIFQEAAVLSIGNSADGFDESKEIVINTDSGNHYYSIIHHWKIEYLNKSLYLLPGNLVGDEAMKISFQVGCPAPFIKAIDEAGNVIQKEFSDVVMIRIQNGEIEVTSDTDSGKETEVHDENEAAKIIEDDQAAEISDGIEDDQAAEISDGFEDDQAAEISDGFDVSFDDYDSADLLESQSVFESFDAEMMAATGKESSPKTEEGKLEEIKTIEEKIKTLENEKERYLSIVKDIENEIIGLTSELAELKK